MALWSRIKSMLGKSEASEPTAEELFTAEVEAVLAASPHVTAVRRGPDFSLLVERANGPQTLFLANIYAETRDLSPAERAMRIQRFAAIAESVDQDVDLSWDEARERLVPVLRSATVFQSFAAEKAPLRRPFLPFLIECVALDSDASMSFVNRGHADKWGVDAAAIFEAAQANAARYFGEDDVARYPGGSQHWHVARDDSYETSRLLLHGWLAGFAGRVAGRPVAIVPSRSRLIVGGDGDEAGLRELIEGAQREFSAAARRLSPVLYTVDDDGRVIPLALPPTHPLANDVALKQLVFASYEYGAQQEYLQQAVGDDTFVASMTAIQRDDGSTFSYTTWAEDVPSLLPRADLIFFAGEGDAKAFGVPWARVIDLVGDCLCLEPGHDPPRWRTDRWPDAVTLEKLRADAVA
jgi:uncharacterized protein YtpQ (UPF0354 family)